MEHSGNVPRDIPGTREKVVLNVLVRLLRRPEQMERRRDLSREVVEEILALYEDGFSFREIAREVGLPLSTVHRIVKKHAPGPRATSPASDFEAFMQQFERFSRAMKLFNRFADEKRFEDHPLGAFAPLVEVLGKAIANHLNVLTLTPLLRASGGAALMPMLPDGAGAKNAPPASAQEVSVEELVSLVHTQTPEQAAATVTRILSQTQQGQAILAILRSIEPTPESAAAFLARARAFVPAYQALFETLERNMDWFLSLLRALRQAESAQGV